MSDTTAATPSRLLFLPGATGNPDFWAPVGQLLKHPAEQRYLDYPGIGPTPADPAVRGIDDLVARTLAQMDRPCALVAQSMGGVVAVRAALQRPALVTHLVLAVTSGGVDVAGLGGHDWRPDFLRNHPHGARWLLAPQPDLGARLAELTMPVLLLWGDADPISPPAVRRRLAQALPTATLHVIAGGGHDLARARAEIVAPLIDAHLTPRRG
ncbi:alpha/beta hydrolase [Chitiniphilus shinanonensis]|uniref:Alpha/beta hydrolase n=1 Tax=Chitiniphilus shinanonensis TaxID=553088 RepID=A0ABQ6BVN1_9NEIS|nr:alpha/beta fold hydrolase [Chitiniphilus shinanonensis]GLS06045.1 alpha/beta hydrolase [Chitiniphilus shinanonensis]